MTLSRARALVLVSLLVLAALILVLVAVLRDRQSGSQYGASCGPGTVKVHTRPLPDPGHIKVNVFNGTGQPGLADAVADEFRNRGFTVGTVQNAPQAFDGTAKLAYGGNELAAAAVVDSYFLGKAASAFDLKRTDDVVDVTIGKQYTRLGTKTEVNQAQAQIGNPSAPPGTCDVS
jgi:LytR cell envelope-related transcriptional attenuator